MSGDLQPRQRRKEKKRPKRGRLDCCMISWRESEIFPFGKFFINREEKEKNYIAAARERVKGNIIFSHMNIHFPRGLSVL